MEVCINILGRPEVFLTSVALLTAILSVWAQLWVNTYRMYKEKAKECSFDEEKRKLIEYYSSWGLSWIYLAILIAVLAFALAAASYLLIGWDCLLKVAISLFGVSLYMTGIQVLQSLLSAFNKFFKGKTLDEPYKLVSHCCLKIIMCLLIALGIIIFIGILVILVLL